MATIAVVGPGAVGIFFAAHLAAGGQDVVSCARRPFDTYVVTSAQAPVEAPAKVLTSATDVQGPVDWVLLAVKAHQTEGAADWLRALCGPGTTVVVAQNGVEGEARVASLVGEAEVLPAVVYCGAQLLAPGHIEHYSHGFLVVPDVPAGHRLAGLFVGTGAAVQPTADFVTEAWRKLGANVVANGITALTGRPLEVLRRPDIGLVARRLLHETWAVARAEGARLDEADLDAFVNAIGSTRLDGGTSTFYDRRDGRPTEHDALYGAVVRAGRRHGLDTPLTETFDALLAAGDPAL